MATKKLATIHLCRLRVTRLDAVGNPVAGPNNVYVSDQAMRLNVTPEVDEGEKRTRRSGCNCLLVSLKTADLLEFFNLELEMGVWEPGLHEMLTGASVILSGIDPIGFWHPTNQYDCSQEAQPLVAIEAWQHTIVGNRYDPDFPFMRWIYPGSKWRPDDYAMENDIATPKYTGYTVGNEEWGEGIFGDQPEAAEALGGGFFDTEANVPIVPAGGYVDQPIT